MVRTKVKGKKKGELVAASKDKSRDVLARTGGGTGALMVDSASKFLASYGKFITPVVVLIIVGFGAYYYWTRSSSASEAELKNKIERAAAEAPKLNELPAKMEPIIAEADEEEKLQAYSRYRFAMRANELLERPYKPEQLKQVVGIIGGYLELYGEDEQYSAWNKRLADLQGTLQSNYDFLTSDKNKALLPWTHNSEPGKTEPNVVENENPIVVFVTSVGKVRIELFETNAGNAVKHFYSLVEEGFFDRTDFSAASFSNSFTAVGPYRNATVITAGSKGRPRGVELEKPTTAKEEDDVDTVTVENPYSIDYQGDSTAPFAAGSVAFNRDPDDPMRARSEFFVVIEPSDALIQNFAPIGRVLDGEDGMAIARRLGGAKVFYTYVEQKRKDTSYVPRVYYDGWPVATDKRDKAPEPVRFSKVETQTVAGDNPIVVLELEKGDILIELFEDVAPATVANFINLIEEGFYDQECDFYRILGTGSDLAEMYKERGERIIQGGYDQSLSRDGYDYGIKNEAVDNDKYRAFFGLDEGGVANGRGTIAMARAGEGPDPLNSASTEFFINLKDHPGWDIKSNPYCVFGRVLYGLDLAAQVAKDDEIKSAKVIRKRDHKYLPQVKYKDTGSYVEKKPVDIPEPETDDAAEEDK
ncbi:MAG: peptidylprolyl isomerase [Planctomycetes bacterium]|nr:peptidylprolyl isomerase [Planctomycetota bacterium]